MFVPPLVLLLVELLVGLVSERARTVLHLVLIALLAAVIFIQALKKSIDTSDAVLIVVSLGLGALRRSLYARAEPVRSFLSVLSPVPIVVLVIFLFISPVHKLRCPATPAPRTSTAARARRSCSWATTSSRAST